MTSTTIIRTPSASAASGNMKKRRILVAEDEAIIAWDIAMQVEDLGHEVVGSATSGEQAIEMAGRLRPDLVLMDIHLASAMDGITAAQAIRTQFNVPALFLSAFVDSASMQRAQLCQPAGFVAKPFTEDELSRVIEAALK